MIGEIHEVDGVPVPPDPRATATKPCCGCGATARTWCDKCNRYFCNVCVSNTHKAVHLLMAAHPNVKFSERPTLANVLARLNQVRNGDS